MNELSIDELKYLILFKYKKDFLEPNLSKKYNEDLNNLDDFYLNHGLDYNKPKKKIKPIILKQSDYDWTDIGSGYKNIQTVLVPKNKFSKKDAIKYIKEHFQYNGIDEKENYYRFRQFEPTKGRFISKKLSNGVVLVIEYPKEKGGSLSVENFKEFIENSYNPDKHHIGDFEIDKELSDNEVQVFKDEKIKQLVIVFRGTEGTARDWSNNFQMGIGRYKKTNRFHRSKKIFEEALEKYPHYKITLVSHSQSGLLTHLLDDHRVHEVLAYNPAWFPTTKQKENERIIKTKGDPVSIAVHKNNKNIIFSTGSYNPLYNHSPKALELLPQNKILGI